MKEQKSKFALIILLINMFITFLGISLVIPVMPTIMNELGISGTIVGYLVAVFALVQLVASPIAGRWADQFGRKKLILSGLLIFAFSEFLFGIGQSTPVLFISRIFGGISAAFIMPAVTAYIADITDTKTRPKAYGYMSAAINTGFIIGPGLGGFIAIYGHRLPFFLAAGFALIAFFLSLLLLSESKQTTSQPQFTFEKNSWKKILAPIFFIPLLIIFISSFGLASFESLFSLFVDHKFAFTPKDIAIMVTGGGLVGAIAQILLFDRMTLWWGEIRLIRYSLILSIILVFLMTVVESYLTIMGVKFTVFVGFDIIRPAVNQYL